MTVGRVREAAALVACLLTLGTPDAAAQPLAPGAYGPLVHILEGAVLAGDPHGALPADEGAEVEHVHSERG